MCPGAHEGGSNVPGVGKVGLVRARSNMERQYGLPVNPKASKEEERENGREDRPKALKKLRFESTGVVNARDGARAVYADVENAAERIGERRDFLRGSVGVREKGRDGRRTRRKGRHVFLFSSKFVHDSKCLGRKRKLLRRNLRVLGEEMRRGGVFHQNFIKVLVRGRIHAKHVREKLRHLKEVLLQKKSGETGWLNPRNSAFFHPVRTFIEMS